jgi:hypothetical protein
MQPCDAVFLLSFSLPSYPPKPSARPARNEPFSWALPPTLTNLTVLIL